MSSLRLLHAEAMCPFAPQRRHSSRHSGGTALRLDGEHFFLPPPPPPLESLSWARSLSFLRAFFWAFPALYLVITHFISGSNGVSCRRNSTSIPSSTTPVWHLNMIKSSRLIKWT